MGARPNASGGVPEEKEIVETKASSAEANSEGLAEFEDDIQTKEDNVDLSEDDLESLEQKKQIPYSRFKEVNDLKNSLQKQLEQKESDYSNQINTLVAQYEARAQLAQQESQQQEDYGSYGYEDDSTTRYIKGLEKQIAKQSEQLNSLTGKFEQNSLESQIAKLEKKYPKADMDVVLGWKKAYGSSRSLDELAQLSEQKNIDLVKRGIQDILDAKKNKQKKAALPTRSSGFKIKEDERPKTIAEASRLAKLHLDDY